MIMYIEISLSPVHATNMCKVYIIYSLFTYLPLACLKCIYFRELFLVNNSYSPEAIIPPVTGTIELTTKLEIEVV